MLLDGSVNDHLVPNRWEVRLSAPPLIAFSLGGRNVLNANTNELRLSPGATIRVREIELVVF